MKILPFVALGLTLLNDAASASPMTPISPSQALSNEGQCVTVEGEASIMPDSLRSGTDILLRDKHGVLVGYIPAEDMAQFPKVKSFEGKLVDITGVIQFHLSQPEIKMMSTHQLLMAPTNGKPYQDLQC
jgi:hypothetical protein